ncbi:uncharacterized protein F4822DRAFT_420726 [Hypoxylon trugodes]|uniref:uncharacterized protein n=1 Tax=Hypoxylon trugodes TaxID=326681 RepID=UPI0021918E21|nr:uncharacterized protein F4822DRAFT_420726 [Hypoxylon trugodes]KAI1383467.1 hypothetical protein F4822DRAFT_420726 [Hypoxylon trugodes]
MPRNSESEHSATADLVFEPDRDCDGGETQDQQYTDNFTAYQQPVLNDGNFYSTQTSGSGAQPRTFTTLPTESEHDLRPGVNDVDINYTFQRHAPSSINTDSTFRAGRSYTRKYVEYMLHHDYDDEPDEPSQPLTTYAMAAHDYSHNTTSYDGKISSWLPQQGLSFQADQTNDWSTGNLVPPSPKSQTSTTTGSWCLVPLVQDQHTADPFCAIGVWSDSMSADPYTTLARNIRDEDVSDNRQ